MKKIEFKDFNLQINLTTFINIIGPPASGKTTLLKMLVNKIPGADILIDDIPINDYDLNYKKRNIAACFYDLRFNCSSVQEELRYYQDKLGFSEKDINNNIQKIGKYFGLLELFDVTSKDLEVSQIALIKILSLLIINPKIIGIDNLLSLLSTCDKLKIIKYAKEKNVSILNVTTDHEELLLGIDIIILENFKVLAYDKTKKILDNEQLLSSVGYELPFVINLSNGLNSYEILNKKYYDLKSIMRSIWK